MLVVGLTGSVSSGKNFVAEIFSEFGAKVFDADVAVHDIFRSNKAVFTKIKEFFPKAVIDNKIDRKELGKIVFGNKDLLKILEEIVHPEITKKRQDFIKKARYSKARLVILNIPLLFEKDIHLLCSQTILVVSPNLIKQCRFIKRSKNLGYNNSDFLIEKFHNILKNQMSDSNKMKLADFVIYNGQSKAFTRKQALKIFNKISKYEK